MYQNEILKKSNRDLFFQRYPKYTFFFKEDFSKFSFCKSGNELNLKSKNKYLYSKEIEEQHRDWFESLEIGSDTSILFIHGLGLGYSYPFLKKWQTKKRGRHVFFIEDDPTLFSHFLKTSLSTKILKDPSFHIFFKIEDENLFIEQICSFLPTFKMQIFSSPYKKEDVEFKTKILRSQTYFAALLQNDLYFNQIFEHFCKNVKKIPKSFYVNSLKDRFKGIAAIICGAGPSLYQQKELLRNMRDRALIIAGGSAISALSSYGIAPHLGVVIDPNYDEVERMKKNKFDIPILYGTRVHSKVFDHCRGPIGYIRSNFGSKGDFFLDKKLNLSEEMIGNGLSRESLSVTSLNISLAHFLGLSPIILVGVDLAYLNQKRYAQGIISDKDNNFQKNDIGDLLIERKSKNKNILTCIKWLMESSAIADFAKKFSLEIYDGSKGLGFEGISKLSLKDFAKRDFKNLDLDEKVRAEISKCSLLDKESLINEFLYDLKMSLKRCKDYASLIKNEIKTLLKNNEKKQETPHMILSLLELEKEIGYIYFTKQIKKAINTHLKTHYKPWQEGFKDQLKMDYDLWNNFEMALRACLEVI